MASETQESPFWIECSKFSFFNTIFLMSQIPLKSHGHTLCLFYPIPLHPRGLKTKKIRVYWSSSPFCDDSRNPNSNFSNNYKIKKVVQFPLSVSRHCNHGRRFGYSGSKIVFFVFFFFIRTLKFFHQGRWYLTESDIIGFPILYVYLF